MDTNMFIPYAAAGLGFVSVMLFSIAIGSTFGSRGRTSRLKERVSGPVYGQRKEKTGITKRIAAVVARFGERMAPKDEEEVNETGKTLMRAGFTSRHAPTVYFGIKAFMAFAGLGVGMAVKMTPGLEIPIGLVALTFILPACIGLYLPNIWLSMRVTARRTEILNAMPDALDLLVVCVEAGMGIDQAISRVSREIALSSKVLAKELHLVTLELRAGKSRADALRGLSHRVGVEDITSLVSLIVQADAFGTSIAQTLRVYADALRTSRYQRAEEIAAKMPVKILFPLVFCILPALFVSIMGPAAINLMKVFEHMN